MNDQKSLRQTEGDNRDCLQRPCSAAGGKLTPAQVKNWRNVLIGIIGPYASIMSDDEIEQFKKHVESEVNKQPNDRS
jgi:hypothetical protein